jgi:Fe2+ transport system protein B
VSRGQLEQQPRLRNSLEKYPRQQNHACNISKNKNTAIGKAKSMAAKSRHTNTVPCIEWIDRIFNHVAAAFSMLTVVFLSCFNEAV